MSLFRLLWLRRFIRKNTNPIPMDSADVWKKRLSFAYMFFGWNAFGLVCYMVYVGKADWAKYHGIKNEAEANMPPGQSWAKTLDIKNAKVVRISGMRAIDSYEVVDGEIVREENTTQT